MKKKFVGLLLACALFTTAGLAATGLAACGKDDNKNHGNNETTEETGGEGGSGGEGGGSAVGSETSKQAWDESLTSADNFTLKNSVDIPNQGVMIVTFKIDGNKCEQTQSDGARFVGVKEESGFAQYDYNADNDTWYKVKETSIAQFVYETNLTFPAQLAKHFDDFTFANGKYTCANIEITYMNAPAPATSLEVVFAENKPVSIKFMLTVNNQTASYEFSDFGTTKVEVPTKNIVDETQTGGEGGSGEQGGEGGQQGGPVVLTKETDFGALVSDRVTEEQWSMALSDSSFNNSTIEWNSVYSVQDSRTAYRKCMMEGENKYVSGYVEGEYATFVTYEDGKMYMYSQSGDGKYTRSELEKTSWDLYIAYTLICPDFRDCYSQFTYNKDTGAYEYHGTGIESNAPMEPDPDWTMTYVNIQIKFSGGKLAYISCDRIDNGDTEHYTFKCYDYGKTEVELPEDYSGEGEATGGEIGSEMWDESLASADNFTVTLAVKLADTDDSPMATMLTIRADGDKVEQEQADGRRIIVVKEEKSYTQYATEDGDSWVRQTESQEAAQLFVAYMSFPKFFMGHFADFTYQNGKYVCEEMQMTPGDETARFLNIEIVFVDNAVYSITFSTNESEGSAIYYTLNAFGTTEVEVPTENVEDVGGSGSEQGGTGTSKLTKDTDFGALVSDVVTEDQWRAAFSDSSFNNSTIELDSPEFLHNGGSYYRKSKTEGDNKYVAYGKYIHAGDTTTKFYSIEDEATYRYEYVFTTYVRYDYAKEKADWFLAYTHLCPDFSEYFSEFTYNEETGAYEYKGEGIAALLPTAPDPAYATTYINISVKIVDGKLAYISCDSTDSGGTTHYTFKCYDYGNTDFDLPKFVTP